MFFMKLCRTMGSAFEGSVTQSLGTLFTVFIRSMNTTMQMKKLQFRPKNIFRLCRKKPNGLQNFLLLDWMKFSPFVVILTKDCLPLVIV